MAKAELRIWCGTWNSNLESYLLEKYLFKETNSLDDTTLQLEIERGKLEPMVTPSMDMTFEKSQNKLKTDESKFTIVLDKERGIYKIWKHQKIEHLTKFIFLVDI